MPLDTGPGTSTDSAGSTDSKDAAGTNGDDEAAIRERDRLEPEDSIREKESTSESDPMTDVGETTNRSRTSGSGTNAGGGGGGSGGVVGNQNEETGTDPQGKSSKDTATESSAGSDAGSTSGTSDVGGPANTSFDADNNPTVPDTGQAPGESTSDDPPVAGPPVSRDPDTGAVEDPANRSYYETTESSDQRDLSTPGSDTEISEETVSGISASSTGEVESEVQEQTGLEPGEDFVVTRSGDAFSISYTDEYEREFVAQQFDEQIESAFIDSGDVERVQTEDGVGFELTGDAIQRVQEAKTARQIGVSRGDISLTDGEVRAETDSGARALAEFQVADRADAEDVSVSQVAPGVYQASGRDTGETAIIDDDGRATATVATEEGRELLSTLDDYETVEQEMASIAVENERIKAGIAAREEQARRSQQLEDSFARGNLGDPDEIAREAAGREQSPRTQIESQLEEETGVELSRSDIEFTQETADGETVIRGRLSGSGEKRVARETAPGEGVPVLEGVFEAGAQLNYEYEQFAETNRDRVDSAVPDINVDLGSATDDINVPGQEEFYGAAASLAPVAVAEPTPAGEIGVGSLVAAGTAVGLAGSAVTYARGADATPGPTSEVELPEGGEVFASELAVSGNTDQFVSEMSIPDPQARDVEPFFVPEKGVAIGAGENQANWEVDELETETGMFVDEVDIPDATEDTPTPTSDTSTAVGTGGGVGVGNTPGTSDSPGSTPSIGSPSGEVGGGGFDVGGRVGSGLIVGSDSSTRFVGRTPNEESTLTSSESSFFGTDLTDPFSQPDFVEAAQQPSIGADATGPLAGVGSEATPTTAAEPAAVEEPTVGEDAFTEPASVVDPAANTAPGSLAETGSPATSTAASTSTGTVDAPGFSNPLGNAELTYDATVTLTGTGGSSTPDRPRLPDTSNDSGDAERGFLFRGTSQQFVQELADPLGGDSADSEASDSEPLLGGFL